MPRGKQVVKKGVWYISGKKKKRKQKGKGLPIGLIASAAAPFLGEIAKCKADIQKKFWWWKKKKKKMKQTIILRKRNEPKVINLQNGRSFTSKCERISRKQLPINIKVQRQRSIGPRKNNRMIYLNLAALGFRKIKKKKTTNFK